MRGSWAKRTVGLGLGLVMVAGCGADGGRPSVSTSTTKAKVSGVVRVDGKTVSKGRITFDPSNIERKGTAPISADIDKNGHYTLETLTGKNLVIVTTPAPVKRKGSGAPPTRPQMKDVVEGDNSIDVDVPPES